LESTRDFYVPNEERSALAQEISEQLKSDIQRAGHGHDSSFRVRNVPYPVWIIAATALLLPVGGYAMKPHSPFIKEHYDIGALMIALTLAVWAVVDSSGRRNKG
jgi:hypothetical protein